MTRPHPDPPHLKPAAPASHQNRWFCPTCGSSLYHRAADAVAVYLGTLDEPDAIWPRVHQCVEDQLPWLRLFDLLPSIEGAALPPPDERPPLRGPADPAVTRDAAVTLRPITSDNVRDILLADVGGHQRRFVAPNAYSLAEAYLAGDAWHRAIYAGDVVVGFVMAGTLEEDEDGLPLAGDPDLWRFMIDSRYQRLGFGARALALALSELRTWPGARNIWVSCVPGTGSPCAFYLRFGFQDTGVISGGERVLRLPLS
jgi:diamine N-acetyltransferase